MRVRHAIRTVVSTVALFVLLAPTGCLTPGTKLVLAEPRFDSQFAYRDPRVTFSLQVYRSKDIRNLENGLAAFYRRDYPAAQKTLGDGRDLVKDAAPFLLGLSYVQIAKGEVEEAQIQCEELVRTHPGYVPALETLGDIYAFQKKERESIDRYRAAFRLLPGDSRLPYRIGVIRTGLWKRRMDEASKALAAADFEAARRGGLSLVELDPKSPEGYKVLARAAESTGKYEDAYSWATQALARGAGQTEWLTLIASLAMKTARYGDAVAYYDMLSEKDPSFREKAESARLEFRIHNLPDPVKRAALSQRLTKAQLASLLWWALPEIRLTPVPGKFAEIATDVVDHPDRQALVRAIGLGLFNVSRETHRVGADAPVSRVELAAVLRKLALLSAGSRALPACLATEPVSLQALDSAGILPMSSSKTVTGREAIRAIERTARFAREGNTR